MQNGTVQTVLALSQIRELSRTDARMLVTLFFSACLFAIGKHIPVPWLRLDHARELQSWELPNLQRLFDTGLSSWIEIVGLAQLFVLLVPVFERHLSHGNSWVNPFARWIIIASLVLCAYQAFEWFLILLQVGTNQSRTEAAQNIFMVPTMLAGASILYLLGNIVNRALPGFGFWI